MQRKVNSFDTCQFEIILINAFSLIPEYQPLVF